MSIQRYDILHPKMRDKGRFVLYADHIADKQSALDAQQAAHAAEVERLTAERDAAVAAKEAAVKAVEALVSIENECIFMGIPFMAEKVRAALTKIEGGRNATR